MTDFAKDIQERWKNGEEADRANREEAMLDLEFAAGEQWDDRVRNAREAIIDGRSYPLPCLTINTLPQLIGQVSGDRRANSQAVKLLPNEDGDVRTADVRSELIRSIETRSSADLVYTSSFESMVSGGLHNFRIDLDYAHDDVFDRDVFVRRIPNPLAVNWDPFSADPTGADAGWCFVTDNMLRADFEKKYKDAGVGSFDSLGKDAPGWVDGAVVRVAEYWEMIEKPRTIAMLQDGKIIDVTGKPEKDWLGLVLQGKNGPMVRKAPRKFARMVETNGREPLSDPFEIPLCRLPIIRCMGREVWVGDRRVRFGLVRFARDPQRLKNYWRSIIAELLMGAPRHNYIAEAAAIEGRVADWPNTLVYNTGKQAPVPVTRDNLMALLNEANMCSQDMKDTTGLHDASLGIQSNETSGVAIQRRQHEGDIATIGYHDNMNAAMREAGKVMNYLIDVAYDTARTIRTIGEDQAVKFLRINDPMDPESIDISKGRYDVTVSTGPAYMTRRQEASASMIEAGQAAPKLWEVAGDYMAQAQDWPNADKIAERIKRTIPPAILGDEAPDDDPEAAAQAQAKAAEAAAEEAEMKQLAKAKAIAEVREAEARAEKAMADAEAAKRKPEIDAYIAETGRAKAIMPKGVPVPAEAAALLAPVVTKAILEALSSSDILPPPIHAAIAEAAFDQAEDERVRANMPPPNELGGEMQ